MAHGSTEKTKPPPKIERLGRYRMIRPLSKGGMALVYEARRESLAGVAPRVAVKLILPEHADSETFRELFKNEARLGANMHHQNLVQIQDFDQVGEHFFLVMEYVEGLTLRQVVSLCIQSEMAIPMLVIAEIGRQACDGLHYAHQATDERGVHLGLVHRDVKPSNLMLNPHGVVKILDFGISKGNLLAERSGAVRGTWGYMAPEQAMGRNISANADVFGLATILYEMAARQPLFRSKGPDEIKRLLDDDHAARMAATLPGEYGPLVSVLVRGLQRDPAARFATAADFGRALSALLGDPITARDEVVRFYKVVEALDQGRPVPSGTGTGAPSRAGSGAASSPSHASLAGPAVSKKKRPSPAWTWATAAVLGILLFGAVGVVVGAARWWAAPTTPRAMVLDASEIGDLGVDFSVRPATERPRPASGTPDRTRRPPSLTDKPAASVAPPVVEEPVEPPIVVRVDRRAPDSVEFVPEAPVEPAPAEDPQPVAGVGWVTLSAQPYGIAYDVFIDGKLIAKGGPTAPVIKHQLPAGQHFVTISAAGGARKQFQIDVSNDEHLKRVWDFERNAWRR